MNQYGIDLEKTLRFVLNTVEPAGDILMKYFNNTSLVVKHKTHFDIVTEADEHVDSFLQKTITKQYVGIPILSEETTNNDYNKYSEENLLWVIDPLDGTINFSRGFPYFAISIALVSNKKSLVSVIYTPINRNVYWTRENLNNAFCNNDPIYSSNTRQMYKATFGTDWPYDIERRKKAIKKTEEFSRLVRQIKIHGSAVSDLALVASGVIDGYYHTGLKPWDVAAASLIIKKSGGMVTCLKGETWDIFKPEILATNMYLHNNCIHLM